MKKVLFLLIIAIFISSCKSEKSGWKKAKEENSIESYKDFIKKYPSGHFFIEANDSISSIAFKQAINTNTIEAFTNFINKYPNSKFKKHAQDKLAQLTGDIVWEDDNKGYFYDKRDMQKYKVVKIGKQIWMAENLNFKIKGSECYDNKITNCDKYGRLYDLETAFVACPKGWHLPAEKEWQILEMSLGMPKGKVIDEESDWRGIDEGKKLKKGGSSGFNAASAGRLSLFADYGNNFNCDYGYWTAEIFKASIPNSDGFHTIYSRTYTCGVVRGLNENSNKIFRSACPAVYKLYVRCIKD